MNVLRLLTATLLLLCSPTMRAQETNTKIRFEAVDIYVNSESKPLAAYQLEFWVGNKGAKIVGIEGGTHRAFSEPPFHDPKAIQNERVIIAAFNTSSADKLPVGKTRVATIHLQLQSNNKPDYRIKLQTAATADARKLQAEATFKIKDK